MFGIKKMKQYEKATLAAGVLVSVAALGSVPKEDWQPAAQSSEPAPKAMSFSAVPQPTPMPQAESVEDGVLSFDEEVELCKRLIADGELPTTRAERETVFAAAANPPVAAYVCERREAEAKKRSTDYLQTQETAGIAD